VNSSSCYNCLNLAEASIFQTVPSDNKESVRDRNCIYILLLQRRRHLVMFVTNCPYFFPLTSTLTITRNIQQILAREKNEEVCALFPLSFPVISLRKQQNSKYKTEEYGQENSMFFLFFFFSTMILTKRKEKEDALFILIRICNVEKLLARTANSMYISLN
jgi:hypothetical protein